MRYRLIIRPEAEADLQEAFDWYMSGACRGLGADFLAAIDTAQNAIASNAIIVIAILHGARDPQRWQDRT